MNTKNLIVHILVRTVAAWAVEEDVIAKPKGKGLDMIVLETDI